MNCWVYLYIVACERATYTAHYMFIKKDEIKTVRSIILLLFCCLFLLGNKPLIVIDPGHGGVEEGAKGVTGDLEKNVVLAISLELEKLLKSKSKITPVLTRKTDLDISLAERTKIANSNNADLFISIHANASVTKKLSGIETYYLDNTDDHASLKLAERENTTLKKGKQDDLDFILSDLIQTGKLEESISLAHYLQDNLITTIQKVYPSVRDLGVKKAPFYVLVGAHMPCVLVEVSFIDHQVEGKLLADKKYQKLIAKALYEGVLKFLVRSNGTK